MEIYVSDSWIGMVDLHSQSLSVFEVKRSGILMVKCPPPYGQNPFTGHISLEDVYVPRQDGEYKEGRYGSQPWSSMRAHVLALGNQKDAGVFHAAQLSIEQQYETSWPIKSVSWIYGIFSNYGNSIGLPIAWLAGLAFALFVVYLIADAAVQIPGTNLANWKAIFSDGGWGQFWRALYLNPLGGMVGGTPPVEPSGVGWSIIHGGHRLISIVLIFLLLLGIRRRFRM
jgi:hypothetical protein